MRAKKQYKKKNSESKNIQSLIPQTLNFKKIKVNPVNVIEGTKKKLATFIVILRKIEKKKKED